MTSARLMSIAGLLIAAQAWAGDVAVSRAWARASAPGQDAAAVSLHIVSQRDARLVAVSSPACASAAVHSMKNDHGMMMMRQVQALPLPAMHDVALGKDDHLMLIGLKKPLKAGERVPLTLTVEFADKSTESIAVEVAVKPLGEDPGL